MIISEIKPNGPIVNPLQLVNIKLRLSTLSFVSAIIILNFKLSRYTIDVESKL